MTTTTFKVFLTVQYCLQAEETLRMMKTRRLHNLGTRKHLYVNTTIFFRADNLPKKQVSLKLSHVCRINWIQNCGPCQVKQGRDQWLPTLISSTSETMASRLFLLARMTPL